MVVLESCPKHNMVAYLEKTDGNAEFHEIIDFLARIYIHIALTRYLRGYLREQSRTDHLNQQIHHLSFPSEVNVEPQSDPSPRPLPTAHIPDSIPEDSAKIGRKEILEETMDAKGVWCWTRYVVHEEKERGKNGVSTEDALGTDKDKDSTDRPDEGTDRPEVGTDRPEVSTDKLKVSTDKEKDSTDRPDEGTDEGTVDQTEGRSATPTTPTPTPTTFGDDETIAQVLLNMSQAKAVSREKEKGVELKDVENIERPWPTSTRSLLTLKPLPKIDPKDKGKKKIEEDEYDTESDDSNETKKKFKMLAHDEEIARKMQEDWETEAERQRLA
ncbi:hypothetical protein Tco_1556744 [Tanacetum coccineum]